MIAMELLENEVELVQKLCERIIAEKGNKANLKILDIGCGTGKLAIYLKEVTGCEVTGIDPMHKSIEKARLNASTVEVAFEVQSAAEMSFGNDAFDCVVSLKALHEMANPEMALQESWRVLKEGGIIFIIDWVGGGVPTSSHAHANKYFSPERLEKALSESGFTDVKIEFNKGGELMLVRGCREGEIAM